MAATFVLRVLPGPRLVDMGSVDAPARGGQDMKGLGKRGSTSWAGRSAVKSGVAPIAPLSRARYTAAIP
jgi:hypothetical protein